jgi:hypothetical protein
VPATAQGAGQLPRSEKAGLLRLVTVRLRLSTEDLCTVDQEQTASAGIIVEKVGVYQPISLNLEAAFLGRLANGCDPRGFAGLTVASGQIPRTGEGVALLAASQQEQRPIPLDQHASANLELSIQHLPTPLTDRA